MTAHPRTHAHTDTHQFIYTNIHKHTHARATPPLGSFRFVSRPSGLSNVFQVPSNPFKFFHMPWNSFKPFQIHLTSDAGVDLVHVPLFELVVYICSGTDWTTTQACVCCTQLNIITPHTNAHTHTQIHTHTPTRTTLPLGSFRFLNIPSGLFNTVQVPAGPC